MPPMVRRVRVENYKSLQGVEVELEALTLLVGPNGSGKSNLIDALSFASDSLSDSVEMAFKKRGGTVSVCRRSGGRPADILIHLSLDLPGDAQGEYSFKIRAETRERFRIKYETCRIGNRDGPSHEFHVEAGRFRREVPGIRPRIERDRLALYAASATREFRPVWDFLTAMRF